MVHIVVSAIVALCFAAADRAGAQNYPDKPIKIIVPSAPGGPTDLPARLASQILQPKFGQPVVIENRPGAGGAIGARAVMAAPPDGYTLLAGNTSVLAVYPAVAASAGYDPAQEVCAGREGVRELPDPGGEAVRAVEDRSRNWSRKPRPIRGSSTMRTPAPADCRI